MKTCSKCKLELSIDSFNRDKTKKDGLTSSCKECKRKVDNNYCKNNKDKIKEYKKNYCIINKDKIIEYRDSRKEAKREYDFNYKKRRKEIREERKCCKI